MAAVGPAVAVPYDAPTIQAVDASRASLTLRVTAGASGAPAGYIVQWMSSYDYYAYGWDDAYAYTCFCWGTPTWNYESAGGTYTLAPGASQVVEMGDLHDETGFTANYSGELARNAEYYFRVKAAGDANGEDSPWSAGIEAITDNDDNCTFTQGYWKTHPSEANLAVDALAVLGLTYPDKSGSVVYYDIENYGTDTACRDAVKSFMNGWVSQLRARGNLAGVYGSTLCNTGLSDFLRIANVPDAIWAARWYHNIGQGYYDPSASVWNLGSCVPNTVWTNHQRIRQYEGDHNETWGNLTLGIDSNVLDGPVAIPFPDPARLSFQEVVRGLADPVFITQAGDGSGRMFVLERSGRIRIVKSGALLSTPFLDITSIVKSDGGEQGLLGLAFHPSYKDNGRFYVAYTAPRNRDAYGAVLTLRQYTVPAGNPDIADPASGTTVLTIDHPAYSNHNGGTLAFGADGYPNLACNLARRTHAPNLVMIYESGVIGAQPDRLPLSSGDPSLVSGALAVCSMFEIFAYYLQRGHVSVGFMGGAQIDQFGNVNATVIGAYDLPKVRLPGSGGSMEIAAFADRCYFITPHQKRRFPASCDFRTSAASSMGARRARPSACEVAVRPQWSPIWGLCSLTSTAS